MKHFLADHALRPLVTIWFAWAVIVLGYQHLVVSRFDLARPDTVLPWTAQFTQYSLLQDYPSANNGSYVDFYRDLHVAWDSGYYLSIATRGYDDPAMADVELPTGEKVSYNYAFLPLYPLLIRTLTWPFRLLGFDTYVVTIYVGIVISLVGTLAAMVALADLTHRYPGANTRAPYYLLIFPTSFFLAQVYTEGLFVGLAFGSLACMHRKWWLCAMLLAALATLTRIVGIALAASFGVALACELWGKWTERKHFPWQITMRFLLVLIPITAFLAWRASPWGQRFAAVEEHAFGRHPLALRASWNAWSNVVVELGHANRDRLVYYVLEFTGLGLAVVACIATLRRHLPVALFGLLVVLASVTSAVPQSMLRYVLAVPSIYLFLGRLGHNEAFDRAWTLTSVLLMGMLLTLFSFEMWVG